MSWMAGNSGEYHLIIKRNLVLNSTTDGVIMGQVRINVKGYVTYKTMQALRSYFVWPRQLCSVAAHLCG